MQEEVEQKGSNMHIGWTIKAEIQRTLHMKTSPWHLQLVEVWKTRLRSIETEQTTDRSMLRCPSGSPMILSKDGVGSQLLQCTKSCVYIPKAGIWTTGETIVKLNDQQFHTPHPSLVPTQLHLLKQEAGYYESWNISTEVILYTNTDQWLKEGISDHESRLKSNFEYLYARYRFTTGRMCKRKIFQC